MVNVEEGSKREKMRSNIVGMGVVVVSCLALSGCKVGKGSAAASVAVVDFHANYDAEKIEEIYSESHPGFKAAQSKEKVMKFIRTVRSKLGKVQSSKRVGFQVKSFNFKTNAVLTYKTTFENGEAVEVFTYRIADGEASLLGWNINSTDLIVGGSEAEQESEKQSSDKVDNRPAWLKKERTSEGKK